MVAVLTATVKHRREPSVTRSSCFRTRSASFFSRMFCTVFSHFRVIAWDSSFRYCLCRDSETVWAVSGRRLGPPVAVDSSCFHLFAVSTSAFWEPPPQFAGEPFAGTNLGVSALGSTGGNSSLIIFETKKCDRVRVERKFSPE